MATNTTRLGLVLPTTLEPRAVGPLNSNAARIDEAAGCFLINDGASIPDAQAFDGMIVKEKTSGKMWVLQKNVGGTFDKVYIEYPYLFQARTTASNGVASGSPAVYGFTTYDGGQAVNSSAAELVGTEWKVPVKGIYQVTLVHQWAATSNNGYRSIALRLNGATTGLLEYDSVEYPNATASEVRPRLVFSKLFNVNDAVGAVGTQNSGVVVNINFSFIQATMIRPVA